jgi:4-amino-4-deoxy-L-arabinose transferase-like glycosyltransferase
MIEYFKNYFNSHKQKCIISILLFTYTLFLVWYSFNDISVWWDEAVYIGMGKYIATGGHLGIWEIFRPPLLPLIYSFLYKLHIPIIFAGKIIVIISSVGSLYLTYRISETIKKSSGIYSSIFLGLTPIFFLYSRVPMTDIISIFFVLMTLFCFIRQKYFLTGIFIALAFLTRFPQGLILLPIGIMAIYKAYDKNLKKWMSNTIINLISIFAGFIILILPYLICNYILYGNIFEPFILASQAVSLSSELYNLGIFYYADSLFKIIPFVYLSLLFPLIFFKKEFFDNKNHKENYILILITVVSFLIYFFLQIHKELRYSLAFIPYLSILSGVVFIYIIKIFKREKLILIVLIGWMMYLTFNSYLYFKDEGGYNYVVLNNHMDSLNGSYLSTTPLPAVFGKVKIVSLFESYRSFNRSFEKNVDNLDGIFIKDCDIYCAEKNDTKLCYNDLSLIHAKIEEYKFKKSYEIVINQCNFSVYNKTK